MGCQNLSKMKASIQRGGSVCVVKSQIVRGGCFHRRVVQCGVSEPKQSKAGVPAPGSAWYRNLELTQDEVIYAVVGWAVGVKTGMGARGQAPKSCTQGLPCRRSKQTQDLEPEFGEEEMCMERDGCHATLVTYKGIDQVS